MAGVTVKVDDKELNRKIDNLGRAMKGASDLMKLWGEIAVTSMRENFEAGGRPAWKKLRAQTIKLKGHGDPLKGRTGNLERITYKAHADHVVMGTHPSARKYAAIHQFGGTIKHPGGTPYFVGEDGLAKFVSIRKAAQIFAQSGSRLNLTAPHGIPVPARPYMVLQDEDIAEMGQTARAYLQKAAT